MGADAAVTVAVEGGGVAAAPTITLAGDEIDERGFLCLLHDSLSVTNGGRVTGWLRSGGATERSGIIGEYRFRNTYRQGVNSRGGSWHPAAHASPRHGAATSPERRSGSAQLLGEGSWEASGVAPGGAVSEGEEPPDETAGSTLPDWPVTK